MRNQSALTVLLVEDDLAMQTTLARSLARGGMQVQVCGNGLEALGQWSRLQPDVVVLDLSLPGLDGLEVLARARASGWVNPVLLLTARGAVGDRILGLNTGADDYVAKPFDLDELEARIRALARRNSGFQDNLANRRREYCGLSYEKDSNAIYHQGQVLDLSVRESAFLRLVLERAGQAVAKEKLLELVFAGDADVQPEAVEVVAYRLRKKLSHLPVKLVTLRGLGYLLKPGDLPA
jgi:two-component system, OmpR family, response regulator TctD